MKHFDFKNINKDDIYVGDIFILKQYNSKLLNEFKNYYISIGNAYMIACDFKIAKKDAILIKLDDDLYVDIDSINVFSDCNYINYCLENDITDNILLSTASYNPYVGQLFLKNINKYNDLSNVKKLELINN